MITVKCINDQKSKNALSQKLGAFLFLAYHVFTTSVKSSTDHHPGFLLNRS